MTTTDKVISVEPGNFLLIREDGSEQLYTSKPNMRSLHDLIAPPSNCLDTVNLHNGCVMMVDDTGMIDRRPINDRATQIVRSVFGQQYPHWIHGSVVIVRDSDFA